MPSNSIKLYKNRNWLHDQYRNQKKNGDKIGEEVGVAGCTIRRWLKRFNIPIRSGSESHLLSAHKGKDHPNWKGGKRKYTQGYIGILIKEHPDSDKRGYILEHRLIAKQILERPLKKNEHVHHINFVKDDNRPENLYICNSNKQHGEIKKTLFKLIPELMEKGIIKFNRQKGEYYL